MTTIIHTIHELQEALDGLVPLMLEKGFVRPEARCIVKSQEEVSMWISWTTSDDRDPFGSGGTHFTHDGTVPERIEALRAWVMEQPTKEERQRAEFTTALAKLIELGRASGIPDGWVSPLETAMKRLSKNALTDGRGK